MEENIENSMNKVKKSYGPTPVCLSKLNELGRAGATK